MSYSIDYKSTPKKKRLIQSRRRKQRVLSLRNQDLSWHKIRKKLGTNTDIISLSHQLSYCPVHNRVFMEYKQCEVCQSMKIAKDYQKTLVDEKTLKKEMAKLRVRTRKHPEKIYKDTLIVLLRDKYKFSYPIIGKLLNRDHSTIISSYKYAKKFYEL